MSVAESVEIVLGDRGDRGSANDDLARLERKLLPGREGGDFVLLCVDDLEEVEAESSPESLLRAHASALFRVGRLLFGVEGML